MGVKKNNSPVSCALLPVNRCYAMAHAHWVWIPVTSEASEASNSSVTSMVASSHTQEGVGLDTQLHVNRSKTQVDEPSDYKVHVAFGEVVSITISYDQIVAAPVGHRTGNVLVLKSSKPVMYCSVVR